jgi:hypothetical protein
MHPDQPDAACPAWGVRTDTARSGVRQLNWQLPVDDDDLVRGATERHVRAAAARLLRCRPDVGVLDERTGDPAVPPG